MKTIFDIRVIHLISHTILVAGISTWAPANASEPLGTPIWDAGRVPVDVVRSEGKYIGVYGVIGAQGSGSIIIKDRVNPKDVVIIDARHLAPPERRRFRDHCRVQRCIEIVMGYISHNKLQATRSIPFQEADDRAAQH